MTEPRWLDAEEQRAWRGYIRMEGRLGAALGRQLTADSDLSFADFAVLVELSELPAERLRMTELARALDWEKSRLSHQVGRMERRGLVRREDCEDDGRGLFVVLTDEGRSAIEAAAPAHVETVRRLVFDVLTEDDVRALASITERVLARLDGN